MVADSGDVFSMCRPCVDAFIVDAIVRVFGVVAGPTGSHPAGKMTRFISIKHSVFDDLTRSNH